MLPVIKLFQSKHDYYKRISVAVHNMKKNPQRAELHLIDPVWIAKCLHYLFFLDFTFVFMQM